MVTEKRMLVTRIRVLVVDDSVVVRRLVTDSLSRDPDIEVVGFASNGGSRCRRWTNSVRTW